MNCLLCDQEIIGKEALLNVLFTLRPKSICDRCLTKFQKIGPNRCVICSKQLVKTGTCGDCERWAKQYEGRTMKNLAIYRYNQAFHDLMVRYKRYGDYVLHRVLADLMLEARNLKFDYYIPVPTSQEHQEVRQFDTISSTFAEVFSLTNVLRKKAGTTAQGEKNKQQRLATQQSFYVDDSAPALTGTALLLDDIYTSGRTLYHARDAVQAAFPQLKINSFTIAR